MDTKMRIPNNCLSTFNRLIQDHKYVIRMYLTEHSNADANILEHRLRILKTKSTPLFKGLLKAIWRNSRWENTHKEILFLVFFLWVSTLCVLNNEIQCDDCST